METADGSWRADGRSRGLERLDRSLLEEVRPSPHLGMQTPGLAELVCPAGVGGVVTVCPRTEMQTRGPAVGHSLPGSPVYTMSPPPPRTLHEASGSLSVKGQAQPQLRSPFWPLHSDLESVPAIVAWRAKRYLL